MGSIEFLYDQENNSPYYLRIRVGFEVLDENRFKLILYYSDWPYAERENNSSSFDGLFSLATLVEFLKIYGYRRPNSLVNEIRPYWNLMIERIIRQVEKDAYRV